VLPEAFYDSFSALGPEDRADLARAWFTRALTLAAPYSQQPGFLRQHARTGGDMKTLVDVLMSGSPDVHGPEARLYDRLLAMVGDRRRGQYARVAEGLEQIAEIVDEIVEGPEDDEGTGAAGNLSPVAISTSVRVRGKHRGEIVEQLLGNVKARQGAP
jgi:hypothetical protein